MAIRALFPIRHVRPGTMRHVAVSARMVFSAFATSLFFVVTAAGQGQASGLPTVSLPVQASDMILLAGDARADDARGDDAPAEQQKKEPNKRAAIRLFGTVEFRSTIKNLPKWERVMASEQMHPTFTAAGMDTKNDRVNKRWKELKSKIADAPLMEQMRAVNNFFNQWPYKTDLEVWGVEDYWATPRELVERSGDCEDYAIAKYYALRDLGVPAANLRVVALKDSIRGIGHAVLVVYMENDAYLLDNLTNLVLSHTKLKHYVPQYSVNEEHLWRHVKPKSPSAGK